MNQMTTEDFSMSCPTPRPAADTIQLAHGGGGRAMAQLLDSIFRPAFANPMLLRQHDGATFETAGRCAFTTDSFVVKPLFFPGGDIGKLAVFGTVNDLAMCGACPLYLSAGFILEEGLGLDTLRRVVASMREAATQTGVQVIAGDIKVVDRGMADGIFINTAGFGRVVSPTAIEPQSVVPGDAVILSGDIGRHGIAVMAARHGFGFESAIESDCAPLAAPVLALIEAGIGLHCLRDLTRGGLASALVEIAETAAIAIDLKEEVIPVRDDVRSACELLGLDPLHVANEGRFAAFVAVQDAGRALDVLRGHSVSCDPAVIGEVRNGPPGSVSARGLLGASRAIDMLSGKQLPRIC
jgi:hydrogenase expression/formation protein HypE